jgi:hypothetical protein
MIPEAMIAIGWLSMFSEIFWGGILKVNSSSLAGADNA